MKAKSDFPGNCRDCAFTHRRQCSRTTYATQEDGMIRLSDLEVWFVAGSQHLNGDAVLKQVQEHAALIARALGASPEIPVKMVIKPVMTDTESVHNLANKSISAIRSMDMALGIRILKMEKASRKRCRVSPLPKRQRGLPSHERRAIWMSFGKTPPNAEDGVPNSK